MGINVHIVQILLILFLKVSGECGLPERKALPPETQRSHVGLRLKLAREAMDLRPVDLCRAVGIKPNAYSQYESGARRINIEDALRFKIVLGVSLDWIYAGDVGKLDLELALKIRELQDLSNS